MPRPLRVGFVLLADCAPLVMAEELGLFRKYGLRVSLSRELGWATIRDKIVHHELEAAHALAPMPLAASLGLGCVPCACVSALVLNLHGNAITLSNELWRRGVRDGATLFEEVSRTRRQRTFTFGVVFPFSSHHFLLRQWLAASGIDPARHVRIVVVPPAQMAANLKAGNLDGFCAGEPWNSVAVHSRAGWCVATSAELAPGHPEKILLVRQEFADTCSEQHVALVAALLEACTFCDQPANREHLLSVLARPDRVNVPAKVLRPGFSGEFDFGHGEVRAVTDFLVFHRDNANEPSAEKAAWAGKSLRARGLCRSHAALDFTLQRRVFRADIYEQAARLSALTPTKLEHEPENELALA